MLFHHCDDGDGDYRPNHNECEASRDMHIRLRR
jgi:hypothetical protein